MGIFRVYFGLNMVWFLVQIYFLFTPLRLWEVIGTASSYKLDLFDPLHLLLIQHHVYTTMLVLVLVVLMWPLGVKKQVNAVFALMLWHMMGAVIWFVARYIGIVPYGLFVHGFLLLFGFVVVIMAKFELKARARSLPKRKKTTR